MATYSKIILSASTNGRQIKVAGTNSGSATTIHTAHASALDEIHLWAMNSDATEHVLTIQFGGTTDPDDLIEVAIPPESGPVLVVPGLILTGGCVVKAFVDGAANLVMLAGFVNRITA